VRAFPPTGLDCAPRYPGIPDPDASKLNGRRSVVPGGSMPSHWSGCGPLALVIALVAQANGVVLFLASR
jgi:hypothetical protein